MEMAPYLIIGLITVTVLIVDRNRNWIFIGGNL